MLFMEFIKVRNMLFKGLPIVVLIVAAVISYFAATNPPKAKQSAALEQPIVTVSTQKLVAQAFPIKVYSYGKVTPQTQGSVISQASGVITKLGSNFYSGDFFAKGELLLTIDDRDYQIDLEIAKSKLVQAQFALIEEQAKTEQANSNWLKLGRKGQPNSLLLRKPQLASAQAKVALAQANVDKAILKLQRTKIYAPYAGRILEKKVDIGQFISNGANLATIYNIDFFEIKLPLTNTQQNFINLPNIYQQNQQSSQLPKVKISSLQGNADRSYWQGHIVRTEGKLDSKNQQLIAVAQIPSPYAEVYQRQPSLKIGQLIKAEIEGKTLYSVFIIPHSALYESNEVILYKQGKLQRRKVTVVLTEPDTYIIDSGLAAGEQLVTTPLAKIVNGTAARQVTTKTGKH